ncbi:MAG: hypothetical protein KAV41_01475 [Candidatus Pacebacteria bacterium]|nr:hypothetical protein [Candidatus Paceibacterota bacterium]
MPRFISQRVKKKRKRIFYAKLILFFILFCSALFFLAWLSRMEKFHIRNISVKGNSAVQTENILTIVNECVAGDYFYLFSKRNILLYPKSEIKGELLNSFLRIKAVDIQFADFQSININIEERKAWAVWCRPITGNHLALQVPSDLLGAPSPKREESCYLMDENAFIFAQAPNFSGDVYFKYSGNLLGISTTTNDKILGRTFLKSKFDSANGQIQDSRFEKINLFIRFLKDININAYKLSVKENSDYELLFGNESRLIFDRQQDFDGILKNLRATLINLGDLENQEFEYIDLRFNNKVLYKFR